MKINNITEIRPDDFDQDTRKTISQLAEILNPFMQQVVEVNDNRIDYENRVENLINIEITVDSSGVPTLNNKVKTGITSSRGFSVIAAFNLTTVNVYPTGVPFILYTQLSGGFIQVNKITNLPANQKFKLTIIAH